MKMIRPIFSGFSYILSDISCYSLRGSDDFVLFYLLDGNGALFAYVLSDIPVLLINLIRIFGWKHSYCNL